MVDVWEPLTAEVWELFEAEELDLSLVVLLSFRVSLRELVEDVIAALEVVELGVDTLVVDVLEVVSETVSELYYGLEAISSF